MNISYFDGSPIYIKRENKLFLIGMILIESNELYIFNRSELMDIRKKIENIELRFKLCRMKKLDFSQDIINDDEMYFIFQYDYINLEYLNLENSNITDKGIKALLNDSLRKIKYLNISNNPITDDGLTYLKHLSNLEELILLNMDKLSEDYFAFLQLNNFISDMKNLKCDKKRLTLKHITRNYNNFFLPNLTTVKIISQNLEIQRELKYLLILDKIISRIIELDLSHTGLIDNGMLRLTKNIHFFKKIEIINLENNRITTESIKYIDQIEKQKIKIILDKNNIKPRMHKDKYNILLGGNTFSGKSAYLNAYFDKTFYEFYSDTLGLVYKRKQYENINFVFLEISRVERRFGSMNYNYIIKTDGIILLFDISNRNDFEKIPNCLEMITDYYELEDFPVLFIGNKADNEKAVKDEEIKEFLKKEKFIGYYEVSSKTFLNVDESFNFMLDYIYKKEKKFPIAKSIKEKGELIKKIKK